MKECVFKGEGVSFAYSKKKILSEVEFCIPKNKITMICGKNGSGKTTLIKLLCGLLKSTGGLLELHGKRLQGYSRDELYRQLSYVPQMANVDLPLSVRDVISMGRFPHQVFWNDRDLSARYVGDIIDKLHLGRLADSLYNHLSGGEKQKVMIARALVQSEDLILLDEPTAFLDVANRMEILRILSDLRDLGTTIVMVSHNINEMSEFADYVMCVKDGGILEGYKNEVLVPKILTDVFGTSVYEVGVYNDVRYFGV